MPTLEERLEVVFRLNDVAHKGVHAKLKSSLMEALGYTVDSPTPTNSALLGNMATYILPLACIMRNVSVQEDISKEPMLVCSNCGRTYYKSDLQTTDIGEKLVYVDKYCSKCGASVSDTY